MKVAVVTPYYKESRAWLERCLRSVATQTHACDHIVVSDGHPQDWIDETGVRHIRLDRCHADYGNTPRSIGGQLAVAEGYDAIAFLDADNWFDPNHVQACVETAEATDADYVIANRRWVRDDGSKLQFRCGEDDDGSHVDTNCFFLLFGAFHTISRWLMMPKPMAMWCDRFYLESMIQDGLHPARNGAETVNYLCTWLNVFQALGETPPVYAKQGVPEHRLLTWIQQLQPHDTIRIQRLSGCNLAQFFKARRGALDTQGRPKVPPRLAEAA